MKLVVLGLALVLFFLSSLSCIAAEEAKKEETIEAATTPEPEIPDNFGEVIDMVQVGVSPSNNFTYFASTQGTLVGFCFTEQKFTWRTELPNPQGVPSQELVTQLLTNQRLIVTIGKHTIHGWDFAGKLLWSYTPKAERLDVFFLGHSGRSLVLSLATKQVVLLSPDSGKPTSRHEAPSEAFRFAVVPSSTGLQMVWSTPSGKIKIGTLDGKTVKREIDAFDGEFAILQPEVNYILYKKDSNRVIFQHLDSGEELPTYYFAERITNLHSLSRSKSAKFVGKKSGEQVVLRVSDDTVLEWRIGSPTFEHDVDHRTDSMWVCNPTRPIVRHVGKSRMGMPSEGGKFFKRAWHIQGDRKHLVLTVGSVDNALVLWRHIEGFNMLSHLKTWEQGPKNKWNGSGGEEADEDEDYYEDEDSEYAEREDL